jgi:geranylgeranyl diphosphate synthase type I
MVTPPMRTAIDRLPHPMRRIAGYHLGWWDENGQRTHTGEGKSIRPTLVLLAAEAAGGRASPAVGAAVAVELVHNFSLLHDDVLDRDLTRRHRPTAWTVFGVAGAILAGDLLLSLALDVIGASDHPGATQGARMLNAAVLNMIHGQSTDMSFEERPDVALSECLSMIERKTGALLGCACALGASFGGGTPEQVDHLRRFGEDLGVAFQLVDDLLGIWGDPGRTGKPVYSDLQYHKKSAPIVAALSSPTPAGRELAELYGSDQPLSGDDLVRAAALVEAAGGRAWSEAQIGDLTAQALRHLQSAGPTEQAAAELKTLTRLIVGRDH